MSENPKVWFKTEQDVKDYKPDVKRLFSATHQEILGGATQDVYFAKTQEILEREGEGKTRATAEIFASGQGIMAGTQECLELLSGLNIKIMALPEGEPFKEKDVVMRLEGPYSAFGPYETALLGILASSSGWATAAKICKDAAQGKPVICFGARHIHPAIAPVMERSAIVGGADGAACILGAKLMGLEPSGTIPHALVLLMGDTVRTAVAYNKYMSPQSPRTILVDTFHDEAEEALNVAKALGKDLQSIRLDTPGERGGVTPGLVREVRARLDMAGHSHVRIFVSGGLTPERITILSEAGTDAFGVGSYIAGARAINMTMDIKEIEGKPIAKRGRIPGITPSPKLKEMI